MYKKLYYITITALSICLVIDLYAFLRKGVFHLAIVKGLSIATVGLVTTYLLCIIYQNRKKCKRHEQIDKLLDKN